MFRYERRAQPPLPARHFARRVLAHVLLIVALGIFSLAIGMIGYVSFERLDWLDAFLESAMLLGGMGPIHSPATPGGKLFAGLYSLYAGLVFLVAASVMAAPIVHRVLHTLHQDDAL